MGNRDAAITNSWRQTLVRPDATIHDAMKVIGDSRRHICIVTDETDKLLGTVTDGDIRRAILRSVAIDQAVTDIMSPSPVSAPEETPRRVLLVTMEAKGIREIPLVDEAGHVVGLHSLSVHPGERETHDNWVVLMAGGLGKRLRPHTDKLPKSMLEVGSQPVLETIIRQVMKHGFRRFLISVNYKADVITEHFGDGSGFGAEVRYLREDQPLGTAGSLSLMGGRPDEPLLIVNGDVLNLINFSGLLQYHHDQKSMATMCVRDSEFQVPFGIVSIEDGIITRIVEKPSQRHFVNAGIYVLDPRAIDFIPEGIRFDMPDLFNVLVEKGHKTVAFPVGEYWADIGSPQDLEQADEDFEKNFQ